MAGSYNHVKDGWSLIENMGDAYEVVEELLYLVESKIGEKEARHMLKTYYYPMKRGELAKSKELAEVERLMES